MRQQSKLRIGFNNVVIQLINILDEELFIALEEESDFIFKLRDIQLFAGSSCSIDFFVDVFVVFRSFVL
jgi:hypothetical protein